MALVDPGKAVPGQAPSLLRSQMGEMLFRAVSYLTQGASFHALFPLRRLVRAANPTLGQPLKAGGRTNQGWHSGHSASVHNFTLSVSLWVRHAPFRASVYPQTVRVGPASEELLCQLQQGRRVSQSTDLK